MILIQLFIPTSDNEGKAFPKSVFEDIKFLCTEKFGGVTSLAQLPAEGVWEKGGEVDEDRLVIFEVIAEEMDKHWWYNYKETLERLLQQEKILIRWLPISIL